jgi:hypothetical protein
MRKTQGARGYTRSRIPRAVGARSARGSDPAETLLEACKLRPVGVQSDGDANGLRDAGWTRRKKKRRQVAHPRRAARRSRTPDVDRRPSTVCDGNTGASPRRRPKAAYPRAGFAPPPARFRGETAPLLLDTGGTHGRSVPVSNPRPRRDWQRTPGRVLIRASKDALCPAVRSPSGDKDRVVATAARLGLDASSRPGGRIIKFPRVSPSRGSDPVFGFGDCFDNPCRQVSVLARLRQMLLGTTDQVAHAVRMV